MGSMIMDEYYNRFFEFLKYVEFIKDKKVKIQSFLSGLSSFYRDNIKYYNPTIDPGGYWWPPAYYTWTHTIVSFIFLVSLIVAQFTIFSSSSGLELPELF
jgi:hypothetical protein